MLKTQVVNRCLATIGELPLNTLTDPHPYKGAALDQLDIQDKLLQSTGAWYNKECLTIAPSAADGLLYVPGDTIDVRPMHRYRRITQRGRYLYDNDKGQPCMDETISVQLIRRIPFEDLPIAASTYIGLRAVLAFQREYDGDSTKTRQLESEVELARINYNAMDTTHSQNNLIDTNPRLQRVKNAYPRLDRALIPYR